MHRTLARTLRWTTIAITFATGLSHADPPGPATNRQDPAASADSLKRETVIRYDARFFASRNPKTALDIIRILPGFTFSPGDSSVRGFTGAAGNVLIDGTRPADKQFTLDQVLARIPADQVARVEIIRGGAPGIEMLEQTVVANVVRRRAAQGSLTVTATNARFADGHNTPSLTLEGTHSSPDGKALTTAVSVSRYLDANNGSGSQNRYDGSGALLNHVDVESQAGGVTAFGYGVYETPAWNGKLRLNANLSWTDWEHTERDRTTVPAASSTSLRERLSGPLNAQMTFEAGGRFGRELRRTLSSESTALLRLKSQEFSSNLDSPGLREFFSERDRSGEALARTAVHHHTGPTLTTELSAEIAYNWLDATSTFSFNGVSAPLPNSHATAAELRNEISAQLTWLAATRLQLETGIRFESSTITSDADAHQRKTLRYPKPRAALTLTPNPSSQLRLRVEREVGQLDFSQFVAASALDTGSVRAGNTSIVPQQDWVFEAAFERRFGSDAVLVLTWRHLWISDAIDRIPIINPSDPATAYDAPGNIGSGSEDALLANLTLPLERVGLAHGQLKAAGTFYRSQVKDPTTGASRPFSGLTPREYSIELRQDLPNQHAAWGATLVTPCWSAPSGKNCTEAEYRFQEIDRYRADPALNLYVEYQPTARTSVTLEGDNILRRRYDRSVRAFSGPRSGFALAYVDDRRLRSETSIRLSVRRTF